MRKNLMKNIKPVSEGEESKIECDVIKLAAIFLPRDESSSIINPFLNDKTRY